MHGVADVDVTAVAAVIGDRARGAMLHALLDGSHRPAGELARAAGVSAPTASEHLRRLVDAGLLQVRPYGRHRYYALAGPPVAAALEALALIAPPVPVRSLRQARTAAALTEARSCYDHLAGRAGVALRNTLLSGGAIEPAGPRDHRLTDRGRALVHDLGVRNDVLENSRRLLARDCMDWTERVPHLAGALPAALLDRFLELTWLTRREGDRGLTVTALGQHHLCDLDREHTQLSEHRAAAAARGSRRATPRG